MGTAADELDAEGNTNAADDDARSSGSRTVGQRAKRADFCWLEQPLWRDASIRASLLAFARRHDLAVLLAKPDSNREDVARVLDEPLRTAADRGVEAWLNVGVLTDLAPEEFLTDPGKREAHLSGLRAAAAAYHERFPAGRIVLWQEAPVGGRWVPSGAWNEAAVSSLERHGPAIFAAQKRAVEAVAPGVDVGIFVHFPYVIESRQPETFARVIEGLRDRDTVPDFAFVDFYRGWYEKDVGPEAANTAIRSLISNAREHVGEAYYLGQSHTIDPHHTPSRQAIRMDLRASAAADGRGWYARTHYIETERGFDPFVPNHDVEIARNGRANTVTVARDRYRYAYVSLLAAREDFDPEKRFDLWVRTRNVGFHDRRLSLRTAAGDWEAVGDLTGYVPSVPYSSADGVTTFHALDRERFLADGTLAGRIEPVPGGGSAGVSTDGFDGTPGTPGSGPAVDRRGDSTARPELVSASAVPFDLGAYVPEHEARALLDDPGFETVRLGRAAANARLPAGDSVAFRLPIDRPDARGLFGLLFPDHRAQRRRLAAFESRAAFDPSERFDCWVLLDGATDDPANAVVAAAAGDRGRDRTGGRRRRPRLSLADASVASSSTPVCVLFYGLDRARFLPRSGESFVVSSDRAGLTVERAYAMPYFGSDNLVTAARARRLIAADPEAVETFSVTRARSVASEATLTG
jgi:hypothetical protein